MAQSTGIPPAAPDFDDGTSLPAYPFACSSVTLPTRLAPETMAGRTSTPAQRSRHQRRYSKTRRCAATHRSLQRRPPMDKRRGSEPVPDRGDDEHVRTPRAHEPLPRVSTGVSPPKEQLTTSSFCAIAQSTARVTFDVSAPPLFGKIFNTYSDTARAAPTRPKPFSDAATTPAIRVPCPNAPLGLVFGNGVRDGRSRIHRDTLHGGRDAGDRSPCR